MSTGTSRLSGPGSDVMDRLTAIVGAKYALRTPEDQAPYLTEWRNRYFGKSPLVLLPCTAREVADIVRIANQERIGIVVQAGNTGLVGGQIAQEDGTDIVLSVKRLNRALSVDIANRHMVVEAGITLAAAQDTAAGAGLQFPLRMASEGSACIGGAIATNAGGVQVLAHGTMRALTLGLEVVLANGEIWNGLRTLKKDNTGYDLKDLMIGSEGTLGIITAATLKLVAKPAGVATTLIGVNTLNDVSEVFKVLSDVAGPNLTAFEFMSANAVDFVLRHMPNVQTPFREPPPWTLLIDISSRRSQDDALSTLEAAFENESVSSRIRNSALATSEAQCAALWALRDGVSEAQKHEGGSIKHDISVPVGRIAEFISAADKLVTRLCPGARPCPFGHFGDGNVHYNVSQPVGGDEDSFLAQWDEVQAAVHNLVIDYGGSISAEHGIGRMKREALQRAKSNVELDMMRRIKAALDPNGILNPGKLL